MTNGAGIAGPVPFPARVTDTTARHCRDRPALVAAGILLAGWGGDEEPDRYTLEATKACLDEEGVRTAFTGLYFFASTALGGAVVAHPDGNRVVLAFGDSPADAVRTVRAYRTS